MIYSHIGDLPFHIYCFVDSSFVRKDKTGFEPCIWFGLVSVPSQMWGLNVVLECGAIYRNVPPHAIAFDADCVEQAKPEWQQVWDCYGSDFTTLEYKYLRGLTIKAVGECHGTYLFTAAPVNDGFTRHPEQAKEFHFLQMNSGRLAILPTDRFIVCEKSFTTGKWPSDIKRQTETYSCEVPE